MVDSIILKKRCKRFFLDITKLSFLWKGTVFQDWKERLLNCYMLSNRSPLRPSSFSMCVNNYWFFFHLNILLLLVHCPLVWNHSFSSVHTYSVTWLGVYSEQTKTPTFHSESEVCTEGWLLRQSTLLASESFVFICCRIRYKDEIVTLSKSDHDRQQRGVLSLLSFRGLPWMSDSIKFLTSILNGATKII